MICQGHNPPILQGIFVLDLAAPQPGDIKAAAELYPLHPGDGEHHLGKATLQRMEEGVSDTGWEIGNGTLNDASYRVLLLPCLADSFLHPPPLMSIKDWEVHCLLYTSSVWPTGWPYP